MMSIQEYVIRTPLLLSNVLDRKVEIYLKPENLQPFGSYKIRGIAALIAGSSHDKLNEGIYAASAGNMAQAAAFAALKLNIPCTIYLPDTAPEIKKSMIRQLAATIVEMPYQQVWGMVSGEVSPSEQGVFIHPAYNQLLRKGYASIASEIITDLPEIDAIIIPFGVGGLSIGVGQEIKRLLPNVDVYTCEPETASPLRDSLLMGCAMKIQRHHSFVDAIGTPEVLSGVFDLLAPIVKDSIVVKIDDIRIALRQLLLQQKIVCEGAAACAYAAALKLANDGKYKKIVAILSGGNITEKVLLDLVSGLIQL